MKRRKTNWKSFGSTSVKGSPSYRRNKVGRAIDSHGRFISNRSVKARDRAAKKAVPVRIERALATREEFGKPTDKLEYTFRVKLPANASASDRLKMPALLEAQMRKAGIKEQKGVTFYAFMEGEAIDDKSKKRVRAGVGLGHSSNLNAVTKEAKDKIAALLEGKHLANDPFKTTGSGRQSMKRGPDTIYITAIYPPNAKVPKLET